MYELVEQWQENGKSQKQFSEEDNIELTHAGWISVPFRTKLSKVHRWAVVEFRKLFGMDNLNAINEKIVALKRELETIKDHSKSINSDQDPTE